ncbi:MAG: histidine kinase dimerization/phospho-acceptor domain-containing protein [Polaromonas sp.]|nr:histidine kinase dimerization/phospho-acceptor domain-containing protein [Polaromonas sp.]
MTAQRSLTLNLLAWTLGALLLVWAGFILVGYKTGIHEADELTDGHLASVAMLELTEEASPLTHTTSAASPASLVNPVDPASLPGLSDLKSHDYQRSMSVMLWNATGQLLSRTGEAPVPPFHAGEGFETLQLGQPAAAWRTFSRWDGSQHQRRVTVMLSVDERDELAADIAGQVAEPGFWLLPVVALALGFAIWRGLRPLYALARDVDALDIHKPSPLQNPYPQQELRALADSINTLTGRYHAAMSRERELADELAHELRTPLASITLQARALRHAGVEGREALLVQLERDALKAGQVLSDLLSLARASRTEMAEARKLVDLVVIAQDVLATFAQAAHESGHELSLVSPGPFMLAGHPVLLDLALRNLVENAISHTPAGTRVEVQLDPLARWVQVCDNAAAIDVNGAFAIGNVPGGRALGLGLGHLVVEKIAAVHAATFAAVTPPEGFTTNYRLQFAAAAGPLAADG